jgi:hypothetical protein
MITEDKEGPTDAAQHSNPKNGAGWHVPGVRLIDPGVRRTCRGIGA